MHLLGYAGTGKYEILHTASKNIKLLRLQKVLNLPFYQKS